MYGTWNIWKDLIICLLVWVLKRLNDYICVHWFISSLRSPSKLKVVKFLI